MSVSTNDLKNGMTLELDGTLFQVVEFQHVKPGKGGAFVRTKLRNIKTGGIVERTFNAGVKVGLAIVERKDMQYLYRDGESLTFMDMSSYEQIPVPAELVGDGANWLSEGSTAQVAMHQGTPIGDRAPPLRHPGDHEDPTRREGRHQDQRDEARGPGDRRRDPGADVRRGGRAREGRHEVGRVHGTGQVTA